MADEKKEVLVVASKVKAYIKSKADFNTSASAIEVLSDKVREICDQAIESARADKRKTIKDRDIQ
jgi:histone H3/H4